jgi:hypothetical protein
MRDDLRCAERALRHLNRILRGAAGEDLALVIQVTSRDDLRAVC